MRCIHNSAEQRQRFFINMSLAFAQKAHEGATVLHSYRDYLQPPSDGIWATVEFPELTKEDGKVDWLKKIRMHWEWPANPWKTRPRATQQTQMSSVEKQWLVSHCAMEWFRSLRIQDEITAWSEVFWKRLEPARKQLSPSELRRREDEVGVEADGSDDEEGTFCMGRETLAFFDDAVVW
ncbi:Uu.00g056370.m01.CDS01 [Anthostomella pinea]|uniref:Uu.00g056370.m01.CDS01 n=1 Tax=Anthostomella pinea TaxID=933095 RepID=A0AAI8YM16_9PEZI|nr:Uu.00g056370.m01.CDS01 [Anthostomella pinea]